MWSRRDSERGPFLAVCSWLAAVLITSGCAPRSSIAPGASVSPETLFAKPFGPSVVMLDAAGSADAAGLALERPPIEGDVAAVLRPNPCAEFLTVRPPSSDLMESYVGLMSESLEIGLAFGVRLFGAAVAGGRQRDVLYVANIDQRVKVVEQSGYAACCSEKGCGDAYVSEVMFGRMRYEVVEADAVQVAVEYELQSAEGALALGRAEGREKSVEGPVAYRIRRHEASENFGALESEAGRDSVDSVSICGSQRRWHYCRAAGRVPVSERLLLVEHNRMVGQPPPGLEGRDVLRPRNRLAISSLTVAAATGVAGAGLVGLWGANRNEAERLYIDYDAFAPRWSTDEGLRTPGWMKVSPSFCGGQGLPWLEQACRQDVRNYNAAHTRYGLAPLAGGLTLLGTSLLSSIVVLALRARRGRGIFGANGGDREHRLSRAEAERLRAHYNYALRRSNRSPLGGR